MHNAGRGPLCLQCSAITSCTKDIEDICHKTGSTSTRDQSPMENRFRGVFMRCTPLLSYVTINIFIGRVLPYALKSYPDSLYFWAGSG